MNKKRKIGVLLILIGIGIPLVLFFFQSDGVLFGLKYKRSSKLRPGYLMLEMNTVQEFANCNKALNEMVTLIQKKSVLITKELEFLEKVSDLKIAIVKLYGHLGVQLSSDGNVTLPDGTIVTPGDIETLDYRPEPDTLLYSLDIPYQHSVGLGIFILLVGLGLLLFSLFPQNKLVLTNKSNAKKEPDEDEHLKK